MEQHPLMQTAMDVRNEWLPRRLARPDLDSVAALGIIAFFFRLAMTAAGLTL
jgi:hypothetical protein